MIVISPSGLRALRRHEINASFVKLVRSCLEDGFTMIEIADLVEAAIYGAILARAKGNVCAAARDAGVHRNTMRRILERHELIRPRKRSVA